MNVHIWHTKLGSDTLIFCPVSLWHVWFDPGVCAVAAHAEVDVLTGNCLLYTVQVWQVHRRVVMEHQGTSDFQLGGEVDFPALLHIFTKSSDGRNCFGRPSVDLHISVTASERWCILVLTMLDNTLLGSKCQLTNCNSRINWIMPCSHHRWNLCCAHAAWQGCFFYVHTYCCRKCLLSVCVFLGKSDSISRWWFRLAY